jgi:excisionase family DNA binding protein
MTEARLLTVKEVAERLKMSERTIYNQLSEKTFPIPAKRIRRTVRFREQDVVNFINSD